LDSQLDNAHEISLVLGCPAISLEVADKEEQESEKRVDKISHLIPLMYTQVQAMSQGAVEYQKSMLPDELQKLPNELWWESRKLLEEIAMAAALGVVSQLVDLKLLELPRRMK
jgi:hypothetical protein